MSPETTDGNQEEESFVCDGHALLGRSSSVKQPFPSSPHPWSLVTSVGLISVNLGHTNSMPQSEGDSTNAVA